jgi:hypothetical protein
MVGLFAFQGIALIRKRFLRIESEIADLRKLLAASGRDANENPPTR